jgi:hypothetical protein
MDLSDMTAVAERVITDDLEYLIEKCVDIEKADYAVVTGVQIHNCERPGRGLGGREGGGRGSQGRGSGWTAGAWEGGAGWSARREPLFRFMPGSKGCTTGIGGCATGSGGCATGNRQRGMRYRQREMQPRFHAPAASWGVGACALWASSEGPSAP